MLTRLIIRDILLIDHLEIEFDQALNVLTGETGSGKSILLDCLGFVLGHRGRANIVRSGATLGEVSAEFSLDPDHAVWKILTARDFPYDDTLIIRRTSTQDGRKRALLNDRPISGDLLREIGDFLVEIHGQHDDKGLLDEKNHISYLDAYAKVDLEEMASAHKEVLRTKRLLEAAEMRAQEAQKDADFIRHAHNELFVLAPLVGEEEALDQKRRLAQQGAKLGEEISEATSFFDTAHMGKMLPELMRRLERLNERLEGRLATEIENFSTAYNLLSETESVLLALGTELNFDKNTLERTEDRLFALRDAARKYANRPDDLPQKLEEFTEKLALIDHGGANLATYQNAYEAAQNHAQEIAQKLHDARTDAALRLDGEIGYELVPLRMEHARFMTQIEAAPLSATGKDRVIFMAQTNPGAPHGALSKIASGGELSRFLLAIKLCLHEGKRGISMIFDEIDRGIGGATADAVGKRLYNLAQEAQLLVVTHSPQVAACGTHHFHVSKSQEKDKTTTSVYLLSDNARTQEIARMISGDSITFEAQAAADRLLGRTKPTA